LPEPLLLELPRPHFEMQTLLPQQEPTRHLWPLPSANLQSLFVLQPIRSSQKASWKQNPTPGFDVVPQKQLPPVPQGAYVPQTPGLGHLTPASACFTPTLTSIAPITLAPAHFNASRRDTPPASILEN
jgi:hypothetical protein